MRFEMFVETGFDGEPCGRTAYVVAGIDLPPARPGSKWQTVVSLDAADELVEDPSLKEFLTKTIARGYAIFQ